MSDVRNGAISMIVNRLITLALLLFGACAVAHAADGYEVRADGDIVLGSAGAPITIIEYASMTCGACALFSTSEFPTLKRDYIDTGKVRFIFREYPLDTLDSAAFMLARCAGRDKYMQVVETLFANLSKWHVKNPAGPLLEVVKPFGFPDEASLNRCLSNQAMLEDMYAVRDYARKNFDVVKAPTFLINDKKLDKASVLYELEHPGR
jgi:protein-disulfide isomerase